MNKIDIRNQTPLISGVPPAMRNKLAPLKENLNNDNKTNYVGLYYSVAHSSNITLIGLNYFYFLELFLLIKYISK